MEEREGEHMRTEDKGGGSWREEEEGEDKDSLCWWSDRERDGGCRWDTTAAAAVERQRPLCLSPYPPEHILKDYVLRVLLRTSARALLRRWFVRFFDTGTELRYKQWLWCICSGTP